MQHFLFFFALVKMNPHATEIKQGAVMQVHVAYSCDIWLVWTSQRTKGLSIVVHCVINSREPYRETQETHMEYVINYKESHNVYQDVYDNPYHLQTTEKHDIECQQLHRILQAVENKVLALQGWGRGQTGQFVTYAVRLSWRARRMLSGVRAAVICGSIVTVVVCSQVTLRTSQVVLGWYCYQKAQQQATDWGSWVQSWSWLREALDKVCGNPASSSSFNALVSEVQQLKSVMNDAGSTCSRTGIGSVIEAWRKVVQKVETKSRSKAAAAMSQKPAADMAAQDSGIPSHGDQLSPSITISRTKNLRTLPG